MNKTQEAAVASGQLLPLMEAFYTIQGEGFHTGKPAYFIRLGGCDVGCHWCDVKESWNADLHPPTTIEAIVSAAKEYSNTIVITGGEPLMWNMFPLTELLKKEGFTIHLETSGAYPLTGIWDWVCLSPKKTMPPRAEWYAAAHELKVVVFNQNDFLWAENHAEKTNDEAQLFLQPEWSKREIMIPKMTEYVMAHPKWRISLQSHKYLNIP
jgi:organic radical activating enzyme